MKRESGFSLIELLIVVVIIGIIAAIAIPNLMVSRRAANEASAISSLRTLHGAEFTYHATLGSASYAGALSDLQRAALIDNTLGTGVKSGYSFAVTANPPTGTQLATFSLGAVPTSTAGVAQTGSRNFCLRTDGAIRYESAPAELGSQISYAECVEGQPGIWALQ